MYFPRTLGVETQRSKTRENLEQCRIVRIHEKYAADWFDARLVRPTAFPYKNIRRSLLYNSILALDTTTCFETEQDKKSGPCKTMGWGWWFWKNILYETY
jgi:hypothetical protein